MKCDRSPSKVRPPPLEKRGIGIFGACGKHDRRKIPLGPLASSPPSEKGKANSPSAPASSSVTGFTLIEVLVALTILAIALAAAVRATSVATDGAQETRLRTLATWIAQNRVAELTATNVFPPAGTISGRDSMAGIEFEWQQVTTETPNAAFRKVELRILRPAQAQSLVTLNAYLVRPPGSGS